MKYTFVSIMSITEIELINVLILPNFDFASNEFAPIKSTFHGQSPQVKCAVVTSRFEFKSVGLPFIILIMGNFFATLARHAELNPFGAAISHQQSCALYESFPLFDTSNWIQGA